MTTQELRELDAWIAEHVMGWSYSKSLLYINSKHHYVLSDEKKVIHPKANMDGLHFVPTEHQQDAMDVLKKCAELQQIGLEIDTRSGIAEVYTTVDPEGLCTKAEAQTLELAICLFAKQLFSQTTK